LGQHVLKLFEVPHSTFATPPAGMLLSATVSLTNLETIADETIKLLGHFKYTAEKLRLHHLEGKCAFK